MPFGNKPVGDGRVVQFDSIYASLIKPAVIAAGLEPLRADEEKAGGIIHKAMFERLILCEFAVGDLTTASANVFYELGLRHALRPWATQLLFANGWGQLPFDVNLLRALPYKLSVDGTPADASGDGAALTQRLVAARCGTPDSPLFQLLEGFPDIQRLKTDVFRSQVRYADDMKSKLAVARASGLRAIAAVEAELGDVAIADAAVVVDLFLSYRAVKAWQPMVDLVGRMAPPLAATVMIREQLGLAHNRMGRGDEAERILLALVSERGASSETYGLLGRVYKDRWEVAVKKGNAALASGMLNKSIDAYLKGFEADWRDVYPGINAATLMELKTPPDPRQASLLPVINYGVKRRIAQGRPDYWDHATLLELGVLERVRSRAEAALEDCLANIRESWEPESTARNLRLIREVRARRAEDVSWLQEIETALERASRSKGA